MLCRAITVSLPHRSPAYSPSSPAACGSVATWLSFADRLPIASRQYARRYELLFGRRLARGAPKPNPAPPYAVLTYELRRRRASLILAEQLRGGLDALQRRRRPDACGSVFAQPGRVRAIRSSARREGAQKGGLSLLPPIGWRLKPSFTRQPSETAVRNALAYCKALARWRELGLVGAHFFSC